MVSTNELVSGDPQSMYTVLPNSGEAREPNDEWPRSSRVGDT